MYQPLRPACSELTTNELVHTSGGALADGPYESIGIVLPPPYIPILDPISGPTFPWLCGTPFVSF